MQQAVVASGKYVQRSNGSSFHIQMREMQQLHANLAGGVGVGAAKASASTRYLREVVHNYKIASTVVVVA